jgi:hypothetical protein
MSDDGSASEATSLAYSFPGRLSALRRRFCPMKISARGHAPGDLYVAE